MTKNDISTVLTPNYWKLKKNIQRLCNNVCQYYIMQYHEIC
jgi:hypothetical protein